METTSADAGPGAVAERYFAFAEREASGVSEHYAELARTVARSAELAAFLMLLPIERRQPNLFFAAVRHVTGEAPEPSELGRVVRAHAEAIRSIMLARTTQTNEPARCATLLPALARLDGPLALIEVGASAGLCLLFDRYGYDYGRVRIAPGGPAASAAPVFPCDAGSGTPLPDAVPEIVWRGGLDLNPLDLHSPSDVAWLQTLIWPGQKARLRRLRQAIDVARSHPPRVVKGDLLKDLPALAREVPAGARLVIFHTAVLSYVRDEQARLRFRNTVRDLGATWICNEAPRVFPDIAAQIPHSAINPEPANVSAPSAQGRFLLSVDGRPVAWTGPHGQSIDWIETA